MIQLELILSVIHSIKWQIVMFHQAQQKLNSLKLDNCQTTLLFISKMWYWNQKFSINNFLQVPKMQIIQKNKTEQAIIYINAYAIWEGLYSKRKRTN